jgi:hypothetical protein
LWLLLLLRRLRTVLASRNSDTCASRIDDDLATTTRFPIELVQYEEGIILRAKADDARADVLASVVAIREHLHELHAQRVGAKPVTHLEPAGSTGQVRDVDLPRPRLGRGIERVRSQLGRRRRWSGSSSSRLRGLVAGAIVRNLGGHGNHSSSVGEGGECWWRL